MKLTQNQAYRRAVKTIEQRPLISFVGALSLLIVLIIIGNQFRKPVVEKTAAKPPKTVAVYSIGTAPKMNFQAQIEKSGVTQITAFAGGVVSRINVQEGMKVSKGKNLLSMTTNFSGGNLMSISRQLAEKQNQLVEDTFDAQKELIKKQREVANQTETNSDKLRDIASQSADDARNLINMNNDILSSLDTNIAALATEAATNASMILSIKQLKSQFVSANTQLKSGLRSAEYQGNSDNPPTALSNLQKDIALRQLDIQEKSLELNREMSGLQVKLARINEASMYPSAPFDGVIERIFVRVGQQINPGTPLFTFSGTNNQQLTAIVYLTRAMADKVSALEPTEFTLGSNTVKATPSYITHEAINGNLYGVIYQLPQTQYNSTADKSNVSASLPMGYPNSSAAAPFLPLDALYQTQESAYAFVVVDGKAVSRELKLGAVFGSFVEVQSGINAGDQVILDRTVTDGETVSAKQ